MQIKKKVLFLCTANSCRSQMAEGLARHLRGSDFEVYSAGTSPQTLNPLAVKVMAEIGIDISAQTSKSIETLSEFKFDYVITVCDDASENCPLWPGRGTLIHRSFEDPPKLALSESLEEGKLVHYRRVRDEISAYIKSIQLA